ncbi:MAG: tRNA lysidine(34) synthetase TilS [Terriglobia bacterium]
MDRARIPNLLPFEKQVLKTVESREMVSEGDKILVGFSGGPDSSALLEVLARLSRALSLDVHLFHLDHGLREDSGRDALVVRNMAAAHGVPITVEAFDVAAYARRERLSVEDGARQVRYDFLERTADETGCDRIAVGHHLDDNVETFLMRLLKGAGSRGLRAIPPVRGRIIRPLIDVDKNEIIEYCWARRLKWIEDPSNCDPTFLRNRIRLDIIPVLTEINPSLAETIARTIEVTEKEDAFLEEQAEKRFRRVAAVDSEAVVVDIPKLKRLPLALRRRVVRMAMEEVLGDLTGIEFKHIEVILGSRSVAGSRVILEDLRGVRVVREYDRLVFAKASALVKLNLAKTVLNVPGVTQVGKVGLKVSAELKPASQLKPGETGEDTAMLDAASVELPLSLRLPLPGDRFRPLGMRADKKLQDFFVDAKVPARIRGRSPVVISGDRIVWLVGHRIDDRFKLTKFTSKALILRAEKIT